MIGQNFFSERKFYTFAINVIYVIDAIFSFVKVKPDLWYENSKTVAELNIPSTLTQRQVAKGLTIFMNFSWLPIYSRILALQKILHLCSRSTEHRSQMYPFNERPR